MMEVELSGACVSGAFFFGLVVGGLIFGSALVSGLVGLEEGGFRGTRVSTVVVEMSLFRVPPVPGMTVCCAEFSPTRFLDDVTDDETVTWLALVGGLDLGGRISGEFCRTVGRTVVGVSSFETDPVKTVVRVRGLPLVLFGFS